VIQLHLRSITGITWCVSFILHLSTAAVTRYSVGSRLLCGKSAVLRSTMKETPYTLVHFLRPVCLARLCNSNVLNFDSEMCVWLVDLSTNVQYLRWPQLLKSYIIGSKWMKQDYGVPYWWNYADKGSPMYSEKKRVPLPHFLQEIPRIMPRNQKRGPAVRSRRVTARLCAMDPQAVGTEGCGLPRYVQSFHHNATQQATSCNVFAPSLLGSLVIILRNIWYVLHPQQGCYVTSLSVSHTAHGLCGNGTSILNKTSRNAVRFSINHT